MRGGEKISVLKYNPIIAAIAGGFEKDNLQNVSQIRVFTLVSTVMKPILQSHAHECYEKIIILTFLFSPLLNKKQSKRDDAWLLPHKTCQSVFRLDSLIV